MIVVWQLLVPDQRIDAYGSAAPHAGGAVELSPPHRAWRMPGVHSLAANARHAPPTVHVLQEEAVLAIEADATADAAAKRDVVDLQQRARGWFLLMYTRYWRRSLPSTWANPITASSSKPPSPTSCGSSWTK